jgi:hypothetical protein
VSHGRTYILHPDGSKVEVQMREGPVVGEDPPTPSNPIDIDKIVQIGKAVLQFVKDNAPVVNVQNDLAGAQPANAGWLDMSDYKGPKSYGPFIWVRENLVGIETARYEFAFTWRYGGKFQGHGSFLSNVGVENKRIKATVGHNIDVTMSVDPPVNVGSSTEPVASLTCNVKMIIKTLTGTNIQQMCKAALNGDGTFKLQSCDQYSA